MGWSVGKGKLFRAVFRGSYPFPFGMLSYDQCWPETIEDAKSLLKLLMLPHVKADELTKPVEITIVSHNEFTFHRWVIFNWMPVKTEEEKRYG
jgi:hypothetical protein